MDTNTDYENYGVKRATAGRPLEGGNQVINKYNGLTTTNYNPYIVALSVFRKLSSHVKQLTFSVWFSDTY